MIEQVFHWICYAAIAVSAVVIWVTWFRPKL